MSQFGSASRFDPVSEGTLAGEQLFSSVCTRPAKNHMQTGRDHVSA